MASSLTIERPGSLVVRTLLKHVLSNRTFTHQRPMSDCCGRPAQKSISSVNSRDTGSTPVLGDCSSFSSVEVHDAPFAIDFGLCTIVAARHCDRFPSPRLQSVPLHIFSISIGLGSEKTYRFDNVVYQDVIDQSRSMWNMPDMRSQC